MIQLSKPTTSRPQQANQATYPQLLQLPPLLLQLLVLVLPLPTTVQAWTTNCPRLLLHLHLARPQAGSALAAQARRHPVAVAALRS